MSKVNSVRLIGHLGGNSSFTIGNGGKKFFKASLATNEHYKDNQGNKQTSTEWHNIICFEGLAQLMNDYTAKGSHILIEGRLKTRQYTDDKGVSRYTTEIICEEVLFLNSKAAENGTDTKN